MEDTAATIRRLRLAGALSEEALAATLGVSIEAYGDLESYDDELETSISLSQARILAQHLGVRLSTLLALPESREARSLGELAALLRERLGHSAGALEHAEESVGWELASFLEAPHSVASQRPIMFLHAVAAHCLADWQCFLEPAHAA